MGFLSARMGGWEEEYWEEEVLRWGRIAPPMRTDDEQKTPKEVNVTELLRVLVELQNTAKKYGIRISALSVHPDNLEKLQAELLGLQKQPIDKQPTELVGIQLVPWYPETQRLQSRMPHLKLVQQFGAFLRQNDIGINAVEGDLTPEAYTSLVYKFLGVDMGKLQAEQEDIKTRMPERAQPVENLAEVVDHSKKAEG